MENGNFSFWGWEEGDYVDTWAGRGRWSVVGGRGDMEGV
jgi:hypothetical protein